MRKRFPMFIPLVLAALNFRGLCASEPPEPGPEVGGLRLRLTVNPFAPDGKEGYDVQTDLVNVSNEAVLLQAIHWRSERHEGGFERYMEAALSIEVYPAIAPWLGQVMAPMEGAIVEPEYTVKAGETLSVKWHATARHLKNSVSNPLEVQNPDFIASGLHSVHASIVIVAGGRSVRLRSNEQLVPIGGNHEAPKHTYGPLLWTDENSETATLGLGSLDKVVLGDRFLVQSGTIGRTWTLTLTNVETAQATGTLEPSRVSPIPAFPSRGAYAALIP